MCTVCKPVSYKRHDESSADLDTQPMQLKHCDGEYCN